RISRTDGKTYHLFLFHGPVKFPPSKVFSSFADYFILNFRYALDSKKVFNSPVMVVVKGNSNLEDAAALRLYEGVADELELQLKAGNKLAGMYQRRPEDGKLTAVSQLRA